MKRLREISKSAAEILAYTIRENIFRPINTSKVTVFLCGSDLSEKDKLRYQISEGFKKGTHWYWFDIIYPEEIFDELLYGADSQDLLSLEDLLAESVDAILLIPESPGSFTELGAFANDDKLRGKMVCVVDERYKNRRSFISRGPIKLIRKENKNRIIFIDPADISGAMSKIAAVLRKVKKASTKNSEDINLLQLQNFLLPSIYLLEPVTRNELAQVVSFVSARKTSVFPATTAALSMLTRARKVELTSNGYKLTKLGLDSFVGFKRARARSETIQNTLLLDKLRLHILNFKLRGKELRI